MRLYVDMDGVLTDFTKQLCKLLSIPLDRNFEFGNDTRVWREIDEAGEKFWAEMDWMPDAEKKLWEELSKHNPTLLTSPSNHASSVEGKKKWINRNTPETPFIIEHEKEKYAAPDAVLIDDREKNIEKWEKAGGTGILHRSNEETLEELSRILSRKEKEASDWVGCFLG